MITEASSCRPRELCQHGDVLVFLSCAVTCCRRSFSSRVMPRKRLGCRCPRYLTARSPASPSHKSASLVSLSRAFCCIHISMGIPRLGP